MLVLYWMTPDPIVAREEMTLLDVRTAMVENTVRRLPVVRGENELCGIIGRSDLYRFVRPGMIFGEIDDAGRNALRSAKVAEAMTPDPLTCDAYDHFEDVCKRMSLDKTGAYPVLNRGHLVGIISESDLMRAIAELSHHGESGKRITVKFSAGEEDMVYKLVDLARRSQLTLHSVLTHKILDESSVMATLRIDGFGIDRFVKALWEAEYTVVDLS